MLGGHLHQVVADQPSRILHADGSLDTPQRQFALATLKANDDRVLMITLKMFFFQPLKTGQFLAIISTHIA